MSKTSEFLTARNGGNILQQHEKVYLSSQQQVSLGTRTRARQSSLRFPAYLHLQLSAVKAMVGVL